MNNSDRSRLKVAVLRNITIEAIKPMMEKEAGLLDVGVEVNFGNFDNAMQDSIDSVLVNDKHDLYVINLNKFAALSTICDSFPALDDEIIQYNVDHFCNLIANVVGNIVDKQPGSLIALHNIEYFCYPEKRYSQSFEYRCQNSIVNIINERLIQIALQYPQATIVDNDLILRRIGEEKFYDLRYWYFARAPYSNNAMHQFSLAYINLLKKISVGQKKCLVLDCDNTLWGGVIGEDGLQGIVLGDQGNGMAYKAFQQFITNLSTNGILLALCSKNNENDVWSVFDSHPHMLLKREQIAAHRINWQPKDENIIELANELNIGLESIVFVDDSEFEVNLVASSLPSVSTIHLDKKKPSQFIRKIQQSELFAQEEIILEDQKKTRSYQEQKERFRLKTKMSLEDYLASLKTEALIRIANAGDIKRIAQMSQKINQFNLTTMRLSEYDVKSYLQSDAHDFFLLEARDIYGDLGIVGYMHLETLSRNEARIRNLALSCRALGRNLEHLFLRSVMSRLKQLGFGVLQASFFTSNKNQQVSEFYEMHDFYVCYSCESEKNYNNNLYNFEAVVADGFEYISLEFIYE